MSLLSAVLKIAERVIFDHLYEFSLDFLSGNLSGFSKGHSCTTALLNTCEDIRGNLDSREYSDCRLANYEEWSSSRFNLGPSSLKHMYE